MTLDRFLQLCEQRGWRQLSAGALIRLVPTGAFGSSRAMLTIDGPNPHGRFDVEVAADTRPNDARESWSIRSEQELLLMLREVIDHVVALMA